MKKIKIISAFAVFTVILFFVISFLGMVLNPEKDIEGVEKGQIDLMFVGSSFLYSSISPMEIWNESGISSYVVGGPEQSFGTAYSLLLSSLKNQSPKCIVLELRGLSFDDGGGIELSNPDLIRFIDTPVVSQYMKLRTAMDGKKIHNGNYFYDFFTYHNRWKDLTIDDFTKAFGLLTSRPRLSLFKGYVYLTKIGADFYRSKGEVHELDESFEKNFAYLKKIVSVCEKRGIELVFLMTPAANENYFDKYIECVMDAYPDIRLLKMNDYLEEIGFDFDTDMYDGGHPNYSGAKKCSSYIIDYLDYLNLSDHRADPAFSEWNKQLEDYYKIVGS